MEVERLETRNVIQKHRQKPLCTR